MLPGTPVGAEELGQGQKGPEGGFGRAPSGGGGACWNSSEAFIHQVASGLQMPLPALIVFSIADLSQRHVALNRLTSQLWQKKCRALGLGKSDIQPVEKPTNTPILLGVFADWRFHGPVLKFLQYFSFWRRRSHRMHANFLP